MQNALFYLRPHLLKLVRLIAPQLSRTENKVLKSSVFRVLYILGRRRKMKLGKDLQNIQIGLMIVWYA